MNETPETPQTPDAKPRRRDDYEAPHYHDDDELPADDGRRPARPPAGRKFRYDD